MTLEAPATLTQNMRSYVALTLEKKELKARLSEIEKELERLTDPIVDTLLEQGIENQRISLDGASYTVFPTTRLYARPKFGEMRDLCAALVEHGPGTACMVGPNVNLNTLSAWVREQRQLGGLPADIEPFVEINETPTISVRHVAR
jgi:hypothetical protein